MSDFTTFVYPHRNNRAEFVRRLLSVLDTSWTRVSAPGHSSQVPGDIVRCRAEWGGMRCDYRPVHIDKARVRAVLRAAARMISDRYLDLNLINRLDHRPWNSVDEAYRILRRNAPEGAVCFIYNTLADERMPYLLGDRVWDGWGYNEYFSQILHWDDRHAYGLVNTLRREEGRFGAGGTPTHFWAATRRWVVQNHENGIYGATGLRVD